MKISERFFRTKLLLGEDKLAKICNLRIAVVGLGAVGSSILEFLLRLGVKNLLLVDDDIVSITDINRNLLANEENIGILKVEAARDLALSLNPEVCITSYPVSVGQNVDISFLREVDFVFDAIDGLNGKAVLIDFLLKNNIPFIVAGSCSGSISTEARVENIWEVRGDNLIRRLKALLRRRQLGGSFIPVARIIGRFMARTDIISRAAVAGRERKVIGSWVLSSAVVAVKMVEYFVWNSSKQ